MWFYLELIQDNLIIREPVFVEGPPAPETYHQLRYVHYLLTDENWDEVVLKNSSSKVTKRFVKTPDGIFPHKCEESGCDVTVEFDDEPRCFGHSPDEGSSVHNYSYRKAMM